MLYISNRQRNLIGYVREIWEKGGGGWRGLKEGERCVCRTFGMKRFSLRGFRCGAKWKMEKGWVIQNDTSQSQRTEYLGNRTG